MATIIERILAVADMLFAESGGEVWPGKEGSASTEDYTYPLGRRFAAVRPDGTVDYTGSTNWYFHLRDESGKLISRKNILKFLGDEYRIVYGEDSVRNVYMAQPGYVPGRDGHGFTALN